MTRTAGLFLLLGSLAVATPAAAQAAKATVVVLPFENGGSYGLDSLDYAGLARAIPASLGADLARGEGIRILQTPSAPASRGGRMDAATAARLGKQMGAGYVVTGTFVDYYGRVRIDARLIDAANGAILEVVSAGQRPRAELPQMIGDIAAQLMSGKRLPAAPAGAAQSGSLSTDALVLYGKGVMSQEQGDAAAAATFYRSALKLSPNFTAAQEGLRSLPQS